MSSSATVSLEDGPGVIYSIDIPDGALPSAVLSTGAPPSYADLDPNAAEPPSYDSLFSQVQDARNKSNGFLDFVRALCILLVGTLAWLIINIIFIAIPLSMIAVGSVYLDNCQIEPFIPIYIIVGGVFWIVSRATTIIRRARRKSEVDQSSVCLCCVDGLVEIFLFIWFIAGCVWIYRIYEPDYHNESSHDYCNKTLYLYAFWLQNTAFICVGLLIMCVCGIACCVKGEQN